MGGFSGKQGVASTVVIDLGQDSGNGLLYLFLFVAVVQAEQVGEETGGFAAGDGAVEISGKLVGVCLRCHQQGAGVEEFEKAAMRKAVVAIRRAREKGSGT